MSGWWRRNALALGAIVVLVPTLIFAVSRLEATAHQTSDEGDPILVAEGDTLRYDSATVGPATAEFVDDELAPRGTRVVTVTIGVSDRGEMSCTAPVLREATGAQRQWNDDTLDLALGDDFTRQTYCSSEDSSTYAIQLAYLVPSDARGPFYVDLTSAGGLPDAARFAVSP